jgi:putative transcriptional regulator
MRIIESVNGIELTIHRGKEKVLPALKKLYPNIQVMDDQKGAVCYESSAYGSCVHPNRVLLFRQRSGMTQREVADAAGMQREAISMLERGKRNLGIRVAKKLAVVFDVDYRELLPE